MEKKIDDMSFEEAFAELNKILENFENGEVSLETSISLYEKGMLLKNPKNRLQQKNLKKKKIRLMMRPRIHQHQPSL